MVIELPTARPAEITLLSPTAANDLLTCPYRLAWRFDARFRSLRRPSPWSSLGVVAHAVAEDVAKGLLADAMSHAEARALVESSWNKNETSAQALLDLSWAPASPPPPAEWPGYHVVRARTLRRALRDFSSARSNSPAPGIPKVETELVATGRQASRASGPGRGCAWTAVCSRPQDRPRAARADREAARPIAPLLLSGRGGHRPPTHSSGNRGSVRPTMGGERDCGRGWRGCLKSAGSPARL